MPRPPQSNAPHQFSFARAQEYFTAPGATDNKYTRGVVQLSTGSKTYPGAGLLSVLGAVGAGATLVRYVASGEVSSMVVSEAPEVVLRPGWAYAAAVGSGYDEGMKRHALETITSAARDGAPVVVDAGALDLLNEIATHRTADDLSGHDSFSDTQSIPCARLVLTPHIGEATRLWQNLTGSPKDMLRRRLEDDPAGSARELAELTHATVVLKGSTTYVAQAGANVFSVSSESGWAGTAGSGDVLTGVIAATLANREAPLRKAGKTMDGEDLLAASAAAVFLHARAAEVASNVTTATGKPTGSSGRPITAAQIAAALPQVVEALIDA